MVDEGGLLAFYEDVAQATNYANVHSGRRSYVTGGRRDYGVLVVGAVIVSVDDGGNAAVSAPDDETGSRTRCANLKRNGKEVVNCRPVSGSGWANWVDEFKARMSFRPSGSSHVETN
jgi:hypothetical protein